MTALIADSDLILIIVGLPVAVFSSLDLILTLIGWKMAFSIQLWAEYVKDSKKSEAAVAANRVLFFKPSNGDTDSEKTVAHVQASMKDRSYKIEVSTQAHIIWTFIREVKLLFITEKNFKKCSNY